MDSPQTKSWLLLSHPQFFQKPAVKLGVTVPALCTCALCSLPTGLCVTAGKLRVRGLKRKCKIFGLEELKCSESFLSFFLLMCRLAIYHKPPYMLTWLIWLLLKNRVQKEGHVTLSLNIFLVLLHMIFERNGAYSPGQVKRRAEHH